MVRLNLNFKLICWFFSPESGDNYAGTAGERKGYFENIPKGLPRWAPHSEKNAFKIFSDGASAKDNEVSSVNFVGMSLL